MAWETELAFRFLCNQGTRERQILAPEWMGRTDKDAAHRSCLPLWVCFESRGEAALLTEAASGPDCRGQEANGKEDTELGPEQH